MRFFRSLSRNTPIAARLSLAIALPGMATLVLAVMIMSGQWDTAARMGHLRDAVGVNMMVGELVHALQKERGLSAVYLGGTDAAPGDELLRQRGVSQRHAAMVAQAAAALDHRGSHATALARLDAAIATLDGVFRKRADIDARRLTGPQSNQLYTGTIDALLAFPAELAADSGDADISTHMTAYSALLAAKERAGRERAGGAVGFQAGRFTVEQYRAMAEAGSEQRAYLDTFASYATDVEKAMAARALASPDAALVDAMRQKALAAGPGVGLSGTSAAEWFAAASARIDRLKQIEDRVGADIIAAAASALAAARTRLFATAGTLGVGLAASVLLGLWLLLSITRPVRGMTRAMLALADGDVTAEIPSVGNRDEVGRMAAAVQVFRDNRIEADRLRAEQQDAQAHQIKRAERVGAAVRDFESAIADVVSAVSSQSAELEATAGSLAETSDATSERATAVAAASEQATRNVQTVATASEELSASIHEIAQRVSHVSVAIAQATRQTAASNEQVQGLATTAEAIGGVVRMIRAIAEQTNLLALNATIEAARAGDAGRGFAVVAAEVKALASQTASATSEIAQQIQDIQHATQAAAEGIVGVTRTVNEVNETAAAIAAAVEEQGAATMEISRNVVEAAQGTQDVTRNMEDVSTSAQSTGASSTQVLASASELSRSGEMLRARVDAFLREVRAA